jgi:hypothetical protein
MSKRNIHIDRLQIRLPPKAAGFAREIAGGLGNDILRNLSDTTRGRSGDLRVDEVSAGPIKSIGRPDAEGIRKQAADRIAAEIAKRFQ